MATFAYTARRNTGDLVNGLIEAASQRDVLQRLADESLYAVRIAESKPAPTAGMRQLRVRSRLVANFYSQLSDLLGSGVPLLRSLEILERQSSNPKLATVIGELRGEVSDGTSLSEAMGQHPRVFSELAISMVRAGQEGGFLEDVLRRIAEFTEHQEDMKSRVISAMAYPLFLLSSAACVLTVLLIFFVPKFETIFERMRESGKLPVLTEWLLTTSAMIQQYYMLILLAAMLLIGLVRAFLRSEQGRLSLDQFRLWAPGLRHIWCGLAIARFTRILGTMLANGIPILTALRIAKDSTGNRILAGAIDQAADNVGAGEPLAAPLRACGHFPADVVEMIAVGEESNNLDKVLVKIADTAERRINRQMDLMVRLLEPILLLVMAGMTLVVVAALLLPIFRMSSVLR
jgi:general secretion pathway protein F/type IV pilus assembly protein PilC